MKDQLEKFIRENRDEFDAFEPDAKVWSSIQKSMKSESKIKPLTFNWRIAAAIALLISFGMVVYQLTTRTEKQTDVLASINPESAQAAYQYVSLIEIKRDELKRIQKEQPELYKEFADEFVELERNYVNLKSQLNTTPNQEQLVEAMIQNLQLQINLLNQQLIIIQRINKAKASKEDESKTTIL